MHPFKHRLATFTLVGTLVFAGVACGNSGSKASFCETAEKADKNSKLNDSDLSDKDEAKQFQKSMAELEAAAPSELKPSIKQLKDFSAQMVNFDSSDPSAAAEAMKKFDEKTITAASDKVEKYLKEECKIDIGS